MSFPDSIVQLLRRAIELWGHPAQWDMVIEECSEMVKEILHHRRKRTSPDKLAEEVADAYIMIEQARQMAGPELVDSWIEQKLARLESRVTFHEQRKAGGEFVTPYDDGTDGTEPYPDAIGVPPQRLAVHNSACHKCGGRVTGGGPRRCERCGLLYTPGQGYTPGGSET